MVDDYYKNIFSKNLKKYMDLNGKTQADIIHDLGVNRSAISTWCNGTRLPRMDKVDMLAKYFHIKRSDLIEEREYDSDESAYYIDKDAREMAQFMFENPEYKVLFDASRNVKKEDIEFVKEMMDRMRGEEPDDT